jgi:hypothetical protein
MGWFGSIVNELMQRSIDAFDWENRSKNSKIAAGAAGPPDAGRQNNG